MMENTYRLFKLACVRGKDSFGLSTEASSIKGALSRAKKMLEGSGYTPYPLKK